MSTLSSYIPFQLPIIGNGVGPGVFTGFCAIVLTTVILFSAKKLVHGLRAINYTPGLRIPFYPLDVPGAMLPTSWWNPGLDFLWLWRGHFYSKSEIVSIVPFLRGPPTIFTSNLDVCRQVVAGGHKSDFIKDESASQGLLIWGMNLLAAEGEVWRKHRRIVGPAFNNTLYQAVWTETVQTYHEMIAAEGWAAKKTVDIPKIQLLTYKLALLIIGRSGFGFDFRWDDPAMGQDGKPLLQESMRIVTDSFLTLLLPKWILRLPSKRLRRLGAAYDQVTSFMHTKVTEKRAELRGQSEDGYTKEAANVFNMLVRANEQEQSKIKLSDEELVGNIFILLFAGHETTAQTIAATFGFLSLYGDIQDEVLEQIIDVVGWDRDPSFEDYQRLNKVLAAFYEALRMFPAAYVLIREATKDTILTVPNPRGTEGNTSIPLLKGATVVVDMIGVQYNPRYFDDPFEYRPSRWYSITSESEAFSAFSVGPRACIGRKFATTEAVCFLTMVLRDWRIEPLLRDGETTEDWRARVMKPILALTLTLEHVPVRFVRRERRS